MTDAVGIILAAGRGTRIGGGIPKQFRLLKGRRVLDWSVGAFLEHPKISQVILVYPNGEAVESLGMEGLGVTLVEGGASRSQSVRNALDALNAPPDTPVLIHDAARPAIRQSLITQLLEALETHDAAAPSLPIPDAVKRTDQNQLQTEDRSHLIRVQTPQVFRLDDIRLALSGDTDFVDDLEAIEALGRTVALIAGDERLRKITYEEDFTLMESMLTGTTMPPRMGTGYDVHKFGPGDHVTLCGVRIEHTHGLVGHSDADIGWHAATDAILGAIAAGDIGDHFPPAAPKWKDADSGQFLLHAQALASEAGYVISNLDITLICEAPKIKPHREAMRQRTADLLCLPLSAVSVKATTTEGLGFTGRREGMAGQASAVLTPAANLA